MANTPSATIRGFDPVKDPGLDNDPMTQLTRIFVYFLQNLFRDLPEGCGFRWRSSEENTELVITGEKPRADAVEKRPHITCVLGAGRWSGIGLDQLQSIRMTDGQRQHTDLMPMTMAYHCQSKEGLVSRRLAFFASQNTNILRRVIMRQGGLHHVGVQHDISAESSLTAFTGPVSELDLVSVVVTVPFYWQPQWRIRDTRLSLFKRIRVDLNMLQSGRQIYSAGRAIRPPKVKGVPVTTVPIDKFTGEPPAIIQTVIADTATEEE